MAVRAGGGQGQVNIMTKVVVARVMRRPERPERLALVYPDGWCGWFARDETRQDIKEVLHQHGLELEDDDTVVRQE